MMGAKGWVVTAGEYSDYHVVGVFSTEANANAFYDLHQRQDRTTRLEEMDLDPPYVPLLETSYASGPLFDTDYAVEVQNYANVPASLGLSWDQSGGNRIITLQVHFGRKVDEATALKVFSEKRAQFLAANPHIESDAAEGVVGEYDPSTFLKKPPLPPSSSGGVVGATGCRVGV